MYIQRHGMRTRSTDPDERARLYEAAIEMAVWGESHGCISATISQHHGSDDGYLPSPIPFAAAIAARTTTMSINVAALLLPLYEPVKLAEDMAVVDLISRGRVSYVMGIGYRDEEFDMFGVDRRTRGQLVEDRIRLLRRLWAGETVEVEGRTATVTPLPFTPGGPPIMYGGGSAAAARRAARLQMMLLAEVADPSLEQIYNEAAAEAGVDPVGCFAPAVGTPLTVFVAEDPDKAWAELGEYIMVDAEGYAAWNAIRPEFTSVSFGTTAEELRAEKGVYQILTPAEAAALIASGSMLALQPLVGGVPPEIAWPYLELAAAVANGEWGS